MDGSVALQSDERVGMKSMSAIILGIPGSEIRCSINIDGVSSYGDTNGYTNLVGGLEHFLFSIYC